MTATAPRERTTPRSPQFTIEPAGSYCPRYPIAALRESPHNPREHYDPAALQELAESLLTGQLEPVLGRPTGDVVEIGEVQWEVLELAAGHRRLRAARLAGLETLAAVARPMDDRQLIEAINVDNLQRQDLTPLEEARGFATLMKEAGYDVDRLAARIGMSRKYVYDRVKLLQLIPDIQQILEAGEITPGHAILLARLTPADQRRALHGNPKGESHATRDSGLFTIDYGDDLFSARERSEPRKPVSVRELETWINDHVRFRPEKEDLPNLFPAAAAALEEAQAVERKVVHITYDYLVPPEAKDPQTRTVGSAHWKRADGEVDPNVDHYGKKPGPSKTCDRSVLGLVVAGPGRGSAFLVCIDKKRCAVHWAKEQRQARARGTGGTTTKSKEAVAAEEARRKAQREREEAERERWARAAPALLDAVTSRLAEGKADPAAVALILRRCGPGPYPGPSVLAGDEVVVGLRRAAWFLVQKELRFLHCAGEEWPKLLGLFGVDAKQIRDQVAPATPVQTSALAPAKKPRQKKRAGDGRRAKAKKARA